MNRLEMVREIAARRGWPESFAREYVMERSYHAVSHDTAVDFVLESVFVSDADKDIVRRVEGR